MKYSKIIIIFMLIMFCLLAVQNVNAITPKKITFYGDSITAGTNVQSTQSYPYVLMARSQMSGYTYVNRGIGGLTSTQQINIINNNLSVDGSQYDVLMIGTNDVYYNVSESVVENNIITSITAIKNYGGIPIICTIMPYSNGNSTQKTECNDLNAWIRSYAYNNNILLLDNNNVMCNINDHTSFASGLEDNNNPLHPSVSGYAYLANHINTKVFTVTGTSQMYPFSFKPTDFGFAQDVIYTNGNGAELTNYSTFLFVNVGGTSSNSWNLYSNHFNQSSFSDVVITDVNGYPLNYYKEYAISSNQAQFDILAPDIPTDNCKFRVYYGNSNYVDNSNIGNTFPIFADQWSTKSSIDASKWTIGGSPTWNSNGYMQFTNGQTLFSNGDNFGMNTQLVTKAYNYATGYGVNTYTSYAVTNNYVGYMQHSAPNDFDVETTTYATSGWVETYLGKNAVYNYHDLSNTLSATNGGIAIARVDGTHTIYNYGGTSYTQTTAASTNNMGMKIQTNGATVTNISVIYVRQYVSNEPSPSLYSNEYFVNSIYSGASNGISSAQFTLLMYDITKPAASNNIDWPAHPINITITDSTQNFVNNYNNIQVMDNGNSIFSIPYPFDPNTYHVGDNLAISINATGYYLYNMSMTMPNYYYAANIGLTPNTTSADYVFIEGHTKDSKGQNVPAINMWLANATTFTPIFYTESSEATGSYSIPVPKSSTYKYVIICNYPGQANITAPMFEANTANNISTTIEYPTFWNNNPNFNGQTTNANTNIGLDVWLPLIYDPNAPAGTNSNPAPTTKPSVNPLQGYYTIVVTTTDANHNLISGIPCYIINPDGTQSTYCVTTGNTAYNYIYIPTSISAGAYKIKGYTTASYTNDTNGGFSSRWLNFPTGEQVIYITLVMSSNYQQYYLYGYVTDIANTNTLAGVRYVLSDANHNVIRDDYTDGIGEYRLYINNNLPVGKMYLNLTAGGYQDAYYSVQYPDFFVQYGNTVRNDLTMTKSVANTQGTITFKVSSGGTGLPLQDVMIRPLYTNGTDVYSGYYFTSGNGVVQFVMPAGTYHFDLTKIGYQTTSYLLTLNAGDNIQKTVTMNPIATITPNPSTITGTPKPSNGGSSINGFDLSQLDGTVWGLIIIVICFVIGFVITKAPIGAVGLGYLGFLGVCIIPLNGATLWPTYMAVVGSIIAGVAVILFYNRGG